MRTKFDTIISHDIRGSPDLLWSVAPSDKRLLNFRVTNQGPK